MKNLTVNELNKVAGGFNFGQELRNLGGNVEDAAKVVVQETKNLAGGVADVLDSASGSPKVVEKIVGVPDVRYDKLNDFSSCQCICTFNNGTTNSIRITP